MNYTVIDLPFPVSTNAIWRNARSRTIKSDRYRAWATAAGWAIKEQRPQRVFGPVHVTMWFEERDKRRRDLDNLAKCTLDLLSEHQIIQGDDSRYVRELNLKWGGTGCRVMIQPAIAEAAEKGRAA